MFKDYSNYEIEDLAFDESFQKWVADPHSEEADFWRGYMDKYPHQVDRVLLARELVLSLADKEPTHEEDEMVSLIWSNVLNHINRKSYSWLPEWRFLRASAAAILVIAFISWAGVKFMSRNEHYVGLSLLHEAGDNEKMIGRENLGDSSIMVKLPDGSTVNLEKGGLLSYPRQFEGRNRIVQLKGGAFFDIEKNPEKPFIIFANKTVIKVLGTSFSVKADQHSPKVLVSVRTGQVSILERKEFENSKENSQLSGFILTANQEAELLNGLEKFRKTLVENPRRIDSKVSSKFQFSQTSLPEVFDILEKAYGIDFIYNQDILAQRYLNVSFEDEGLFEKLDIICRTMGLNYHIVDAKIIIEIH